MSYIIEKSGIKKPTFLKKMKEKRFTPEELLIISKTVEIKFWKKEIKEEICLMRLSFKKMVIIFERYENSQFRKNLLTNHNKIIYDIQKDLITIVRFLQKFSRS